eukprot:comp24482_c0_seq1/m.46731 comp24482_c0_seq1/g.46731  ORF comp24482_c0_seq1/g.46731 comp24482_c0_seq1/m.46731 type:complete len:141 (-) comp24482_c0_seq1:53-475(-)
MNNLPGLKASAHYEGQMGVEAGAFGVRDTLRMGPGGNVKAALGACHPVEVIQKTHMAAHDEIRLAMLGTVAGQHAAMRVRMERSLVAMPMRMPGVQHHNVGLETLLGLDETIDYTDFFNDPRDAEVMGDFHVMMEHKLGL